MRRRKMSIREYQEREFTPDSTPSHTTIARWIEQGHIPGERIGNTWYVYADVTSSELLVEKVLRAS